MKCCSSRTSGKRTCAVLAKTTIAARKRPRPLLPWRRCSLKCARDLPNHCTNAIHNSNRAMSYTVNYLQTESVAQQGIELIVLVNCLLQDAIRLNASDLHIEPWENSIAVRGRVNGVLTEIAHLPLDLLDK